MFKQALTAVVLTSASMLASAGSGNTLATYEVSITNITPGQSFTPQLLVTHPASVRLFDLGEPASEELAQLAEGGDTGPLSAAVSAEAYAMATNNALLEPGNTVTLTVNGPARGGYLSVAAMMIPTNDTFMALDSLKLPRKGLVTQMVPAFDAGTEANDQSCQNIPGPRCGGSGYSAEPAAGDEGFVHVGNGFHSLGDFDSSGFEILGPELYDWRNSVARITVKRVQ